MNIENYNNLKKHLLSKVEIVEFIKEYIVMLQKECVGNTDFRTFIEKYVKKLSTLNLSRLESFIIIVEIRDKLEDENGYACPCIDSFIDDIYTSHTGDCRIETVLRFKNEPIDISDLYNYIHSKIWMNDTSWKDL